MKKLFAITLAAMLMVGMTTGSALAATVFFQGFEEDTDGWFGPVTRVASGTNGVTSASGDWHAEVGAGAYTFYGGSNSAWAADGFTTAIDIYLDVNGGFDNDTRFDFSSAISDPDGNHRRDFVFNAGYYDDATGPGADVSRFVISASNNAGRGDSFPKNPDRDPIAIDTTGWYTFTHTFYDDGAGVLAVDLSISDSDGNVLGTWTLSDPSDIIGDTVGGNRYGWFVTNEFPFLAIDNTLLESGPDAPSDPTTKDDCKNGGWESFGFKNQGQCIRFVNTGQDSR